MRVKSVIPFARSGQNESDAGWVWRRKPWSVRKHCEAEGLLPSRHGADLEWERVQFASLFTLC